MANTAGISNNFKWEVMVGLHQLGAVTIVSRGSLTAPTTDTVKAALYLASATINNTTATYTTSGEIATAGGYTAGGVTVTNATSPSLSSTTGIWTPSASIVYSNITPGANVDCILLYNSTQLNKSIEVCTFTAQNPVAATLTLTMPTNAAGTALINIA
jgi:hypothetical protein